MVQTAANPRRRRQTRLALMIPPGDMDPDLPPLPRFRHCRSEHRGYQKLVHDTTSATPRITPRKPLVQTSNGALLPHGRVTGDQFQADSDRDGSELDADGV
jgi:hypothetical protein